MAVISGDVKEQTTRERLDGYLRTLEKHGLPYDATRVLNGKYTNEGRMRLFRNSFKTAERRTD